jgi:hypothetical protein
MARWTRIVQPIEQADDGFLDVQGTADGNVEGSLDLDGTEDGMHHGSLDSNGNLTRWHRRRQARRLAGLGRNGSLDSDSTAD